MLPRLAELGYDKRGVWVDDGCRAEFRVGKDGGISGGTATRSDDKHNVVYYHRVD